MPVFVVTMFDDHHPHHHHRALPTARPCILHNGHASQSFSVELHLCLVASLASLAWLAAILMPDHHDPVGARNI